MSIRLDDVLHDSFEFSNLVKTVPPDEDDPALSGRSPSDREIRREVSLPAFVLLEDGNTLSVKVLNLSYDGCRINAGLPLRAGVQITLSVLGLGVMPAYVRWVSGEFSGLCFSAEAIKAADKTPRENERVSLEARVSLRRAGRKNFFVHTTDLSASGCKVEFVDRPSVGERHFIKFDGLDALEAEVRWVKGFSAGVEFVRPIYPPVFELLLMRLR